MHPCKSIGCRRQTYNDQDFCPSCQVVNNVTQQGKFAGNMASPEQVPVFDNATVVLASLPVLPKTMVQRYPQYYKPVGALQEIDVYAVHKLFAIQDPSGAIQHASKKLLLSGVRTGGKSAYDDIREARDTLDRWLQLNPAAY